MVRCVFLRWYAVVGVPCVIGCECVWYDVVHGSVPGVVVRGVLVLLVWYGALCVVMAVYGPCAVWSGVWCDGGACS
jgi:hypothetical protein